MILTRILKGSGKCKQFIFIWLLVTIKVTQSHGYKPRQAKFLDAKEHKKIFKENNQYINLKGLSEVQCVGHCTLTDDCHSVNYHGDDQICLVIDEIFEGDGDSHLIDAHGWRYFKKTVLKPKVPYWY